MDRRCPTLDDSLAGMKDNEKKNRVRLEPELEEIAGDLNAWQRRGMARKLRRWARQLEISALILLADAAPKPPPALRPIAPRRLVLN